MGLGPIRRGFTSWPFSRDRILGLFPEWFAPPATDWPSCVRLCEFPLYDASEATALAPGVITFLEAGERPIVFTPGSAMRHPSTFFRACVEACRLMDVRGVLVSPFRDQVPGDLPRSVQAIDSIPFSRLFKGAAAIVHHGGIGTSAQALCAGSPQLVMPMAFDQHDNADRLEQLGVARSLLPRRFRGTAVARLLRELLDSPAVATFCQSVCNRLRDNGSRAEACRWIEQAVADAP